MTILIGLTGWGDHTTLYTDADKKKNKLETYSSHFPVVEIDSSFYAIQSQENYDKWISETPDHFQFVIKAHQSMTGHDRITRTIQEAKQLFQSFLESIEPVSKASKLQAILFQFPPWFDVRVAHIQKLQKIKQLLPNQPIAIEFRNQTWFEAAHRQATLDLIKKNDWTHTICDEPQAGEGSVPTVLEITNPTTALIRMHGRNVHGWNRNGRGGEDWRNVRYLYQYNAKALTEWATYIRQLEKMTQTVTVLFNNNSGGDASNNAKELIQLLHISYDNLNPRQLDLFE
ncbi:DUF72 domain-containing protein [Paraliobacillus sp. X-1268]|uniref:DUF72 domain-containing protein n=1 Tax=Paraliobacillus sp. X-1268 TaxID=2213193 RepID=UPI000E3EBB2B|nr:DUF72 domain-containing protein [Paraliobacillus sp. X-1268]